MDCVTLTFPVPPPALNAHNKGHWRAKAASVKARRKYACDVATLAARQAGLRPTRHKIGKKEKACVWPKVACQYRFYVCDNKQRDTTNLMHLEKPTIDGIVDSGLCAGDHWQVFRVLEPEVEIDRENPRTEIVITPCTKDAKGTK